jgi:hypothetical protein
VQEVARTAVVHREGLGEGWGEGCWEEGCPVGPVQPAHPVHPVHHPLRTLRSAVREDRRPCNKNPRTPNCGAKPRCVRWTGANSLCVGWNGANWVSVRGSVSDFGQELRTLGWHSARR